MSTIVRSERGGRDADGARQLIRVLSVPAGHVYVQHLSSPDGGDGVVRLADPLVSRDVPAAQWWPPPALHARWVFEHASEFDIFHLHFGFDANSPEDLSALVAALRHCGKPLVYTVHDLRNPHHLDRSLHDAQLDVLVPAADALITLTRGAASEVATRWGREALVLPHPHVVPPALLVRPRLAHPDFVIGVHIKSLRASMDPMPVVAALAEIVTTLPGARLRVDAHTDVVTAGYDRFDPQLTTELAELEREGKLELAAHDFFTDDELWDYLQGLDLSVLPYRFGTHSGWLEACYDLGTPVLVSDCGFYSDQRPCFTYPLGANQLELADAVRRAYDERPQWRADPGQRRLERERIAAEHQRIYCEVAGS